MDEAIGEARVQGGAVGRPSERAAVRQRRLALVAALKFGGELLHHGLGLQVPDLDAALGRGTQPVPVRTEAQRVDDVARLQIVQALALSQVPKHRSAVLSARSAERAIGRDGDAVDVAGVALQAVLHLAVGQVPHLDLAVPSGGHNDGV